MSIGDAHRHSYLLETERVDEYYRGPTLEEVACLSLAPCDQI
jgi:hypothetical protein